MDAYRKILGFLGPSSGRLLTAGALLLLGVESSAAPIRRFPPVELAAQEFAPRSAKGWSSFLAGGEPTWASQRPPAFTLPVRQTVLQLIHGDPSAAVASPLIGYLVWRRNLDSVRFDRNHPYLGPRLPQVLLPPPTVPVTPVEPPLEPPSPSVIPPPVVPEPSTFLVVAAGIAGAVWTRVRFGARRVD